MKSIKVKNLVLQGSWEKQEYEKFVYTRETTSLNISTFQVWSLISDIVQQTLSNKYFR